MNIRKFAAIAAIGLCTAGSAWAKDYKVGQVEIDDLWVRASAPGQANGAGYMDIDNDAKAGAALTAELGAESGASGFVHFVAADIADEGQVASAVARGREHFGALHVCFNFAGIVSPMTWGDEDIVRERFEVAGIAPENVHFERATWYFRLPGPPVDLLATFRHFYGPTMNAYEAARKDGREPELARDLETLFESQNRGGDRTEIPATFLKVTVAKA